MEETTKDSSLKQHTGFPDNLQMYVILLSPSGGGGGEENTN
jgi:hypothetical protein